MSRSFTKLFSSITESTVWCESDTVLRVWITMLAMANQHGMVHASIPGLATRARKTVQEVEQALQLFMSPDPYSRTKAHEGRRIVEVEDGWLLLNHAKYRGIQAIEDKRAADAERQRKHRELMRSSTGDNHVPSQAVTPVTECHNGSQPVAQAEADTEAKKKTALSGRAGLLADFKVFKQHYPRREAWHRAQSAWLNHKPPLQAVLDAIAWQRKTGCLQDQRNQDGRSLIPLPASWINAKRWLDESGSAAPPVEPTPEERAALEIRRRAELAWGEVGTARKLKSEIRGKDAQIARQAVDRIGGMDALNRLPPRELQDKGASFVRAFSEIARSV